MGRLSPIKARELIRILTKLGFEEKRQQGSHKIFIHPESGLRTVVPVHGAKDIDTKLLWLILDQIKIDIEDFNDLR